MDRINIIGIDISKRSFQLHGATAEGKPVFGKKLSREKFLVFLSEAPPCLVVMEACGGAHYWGRQILALGHTCKLIPPIYVKPFLKRQKNDSNDAAAIVEAAQRPTMRFVAVQCQAAHAGRGVEGLGDADEADPTAIEDLDHACEVGQGPGQACQSCRRR